MKPGESVERRNGYTLMVEHRPEVDDDGEPVAGPEWVASLHGPDGFIEARGETPDAAKARLRASAEHDVGVAVRNREALGWFAETQSWPAAQKKVKLRSKK